MTTNSWFRLNEDEKARETAELAERLISGFLMCEEKEETEEGIVTTILSDYGWRITMQNKKDKVRK